MAEGILINGLVLGGTYALLAVGFALIFGVARIINLAHTSFYMMGAYFLYYFGQRIDLPLGVSILLAILVTTTLGLLTYQLFIARVREHHVTVLLITVALALAAQEAMIDRFGGQYFGIQSFISGYWDISGVKVTYQQILIMGTVAVVLLLIWILLWRTRLGIGIRASAQDAEVANLMGINVPRTLLITMGLATTLAAIAGVLVAPTLVVEPRMWTHPMVMVMAIVVLGGLGSVKGSLIAAFIMAFVETSVVYLHPEGSFLKGSVALGVMVVILLIRPEGLFGVSFEDERL